MSDAPLRILMICYYYPPVITSGTNRSVAFSVNLRTLGQHPVVLTVKNPKNPWVHSGATIPEGVEIHRTPEWNLAGLVDFLQGVTSKLFRLVGVTLKQNYYREIFCIPDSQIAWFSTWKACRLAKDCDVIYVTCSPFSSAISGVLAKWVTGKPLVIDFRDAWTFGTRQFHIGFNYWGMRMWEKFFIKYADRFVMNTDGCVAAYKRIYPQHANKIMSLPNGYDMLTPVSPDKAQAANEKPFVIMHLGTFYGYRQPDALLDALIALKNENIEFVQVGGSFRNYEQYKDKVKIRLVDAMPRENAIEFMKQADLLYLKQGFEPDVEHYVAVAAKTFEYIATGLPVLAELPAGDNADIVEAYAENSYAIRSTNPDEIQKAVLHAYNNRNLMTPKIGEKFIRDFDRLNITKRLVEIFQSCVA